MPDIRAGDADRERVVHALVRHVGAGRLTLEEFSERSDAAYRARTLRELAALTADLPALPRELPPMSRSTWWERNLRAVQVLVLVAIALGLLVLLGLAGSRAASQMQQQMGPGAMNQIHSAQQYQQNQQHPQYPQWPGLPPGPG